MARRIARLAGDAVSEVFELTAQYQRRRAGVWHLEQDPLYPGYLFVAVADLASFEEQLKLSTAYQRLLTVGGAAAPLSAEETAFVRDLGGASHLVAMSTGEMRDGTLRVTAGPLAGREHLVASCNRRKRLAWLNTGFTRGGMAKVGLDIVSKT